jgi:carbamoyltransferase
VGYLGKTYSPEEADGALGKYAGLVDTVRSQDPVRKIAAAIARGQIVGWFQGGAEFGPRALGNRSILADPRPARIRDHINAKIKFREDFRPFAPAVIAQDASTYFDCQYASPHMLLTAPVRPEWCSAIPAVVHRDGSARIQTVTSESNPRFYALLEMFRDVTGLGVLLNTSLNRRGMPIVETPEDAILLFLYTALDMLVVGDLVLSKPPDFPARIAHFKNLVAQSTGAQAYQRALEAPQGMTSLKDARTDNNRAI